MLFAQMFSSCIPRRKRTAKSQRSQKKAKKSSSFSDSQKKLKRRLSKPISALINKLLKRKSKLNKDSSGSMPNGNISSSQVDSLASKHSSPQLSLCPGVKSRDFQHTIIYVAPIDDREATVNLAPKVEVSHKMTKRPTAKINRASSLRRECTSLPSLLPHRHPLPPPPRRSPCVSNQRLRCCSAQPHVVPLPTKADVVCKRPLLELSPSKSEDTISVASSTSLSSSISPLNEINQDKFTIATRPPSRHGVAYEIVFKVPSVRCSLTPEPQFGPDYTYSFPKATAESLEKEDDDDWNTDGEFEDNDESEGEGEEEEKETDTAPPAPQCKYGVFFTAAKPPLPPSALERIRRYRKYNYI